MIRSLAAIVSLGALGASLLLGAIWSYQGAYPALYTPAVAALSFGLVLVSVSKARPPRFTVFLGMAGVFAFAFALEGGVSSWHTLYAAEVGTCDVGLSQARVVIAASVSAAAASGLVATVAAPRGGWAALTWWAGSFIWVGVFALFCGFLLEEAGLFSDLQWTVVGGGVGFGVALVALLWGAALSRRVETWSRR